MAQIKNPGTKPKVHIEIEKELFCETLADGTVVEFIRVFRYEDGILILPPTDLELDGATPFTVTDEAAVAKCPVDVSSLPPIYDVEKEKFCETIIDANGDEAEVEFIRVSKFQDGLLISATDYELDLQTAYAVIDEANVKSCEPDQADQCFIVDVFRCEGGVNGVEEQIWYASAVGGASSNEAVTDGFTLLDECGLPAHENAPDTVQINPTAQSTNINVQVGGANDLLPDQHILNFFVKVPNGGAQLRGRSGGVHAGLIATGNCLGKLAEDGRYQAPDQADSVVINATAIPGIYKVRAYVHDPTASGNVTINWSTDGGLTFGAIPEDALFTTPPTVFQEKVIYNKTTGEYTSLDGTLLDPELISCYDLCQGDMEVVVVGGIPAPADASFDVERKELCDKQADGTIVKFSRHTVYNPDGTVSNTYDTEYLDDAAAYVITGDVIDCDGKCDKEVLLEATFTVDDTAAQALDLTGAEASRCAKIQIIGGYALFTLAAGSVPSGDLAGAYSGIRVDECGIVEIGCCGGHCGSGSLDELQNFQIIAGPGQQVTYTVTYFG